MCMFILRQQCTCEQLTKRHMPVSYMHTHIGYIRYSQKHTIADILHNICDEIKEAIEMKKNKNRCYLQIIV